ncbi:MAG: VWA domain-containing protein, partial [Planctomycetota bacterium]|nr:VWA domain-containing protein [Planctomycetota bacterium]
LEEEVESQYERRLIAGDDSLRDVLVRFDEATRLERVETALMNSEQGLLDQLREFHEVSVFGLVGSDSVVLNSGESVGATHTRWSAALPYLSEITDLATGLSNIQTSGGESTEREDRTDSLERQSVAILISDGQHNAKSSPIDVARQLANQGTTIYSVGTGGLKQARDVAILSLDYPGRVFRNDRVRGELLMLDHGQSGLPLLIQIKSEDEVLWQESLQTQGSGQRRIEFDFPIAGEVDRLEGLDLNRVEQHVLPVELQALIAPLPDELETANNSKTLSIGVVTQTFKVLLMDGRSRWETRYLRNVFERDERWEVTFVLAGPGTHHPSLPRGEEADQFPLTRSQLFDYDLIILGEVERQLFEEHELQWVEEFVSKRGGGLIWLDGQRQKLRKYQGSNLGPLLPVSWIDDSPIEAITQFDLTSVGGGAAALRFQGRDLENQNFWNQLPAPKTVQSIEVKPGASVWVDVVAGDARYPGIVSQRVGAGRILFFSFDETWRWRFKSADLWHQRFWNQIAMTTMPAPFTASDDFMAVDTGAFSYSKGEPIAIRVRLSDENGKPNPSAFVEALVWNQDELVSTVHLESDPEVPGIYRSQAGALPPGEYRVTVRASGYTQDALKASSEFVVEGDMSTESAETRVNMALLGQMAKESGGRVLLEEEMNQLPELLKQFSSGKVVETETPLWQSYFWFSTVLLLLSAEWFLRKRSGLL